MQVTFTGTPTEVVQETLAFLQVLGGRANPTPAPQAAPIEAPVAQETKPEPKAAKAPRAPKEAPAAQETKPEPAPAPAPAKEEPKAAEPEPPLEDGAFRAAASKKIFDRLTALKKDSDMKTETGKVNVTEIQKFVFKHLAYGKFGEVPPTERRDVLAKLDTILAGFA